jgi:uracil-DNA glycosylase
MFIGQAMPRVKRNPHDWPSLNEWLYSIGLTDDWLRSNAWYSALVDYFPGAKNGSHVVPGGAEIMREQDRLAETIKSFEPEVVVPIGRLSIGYCLGQKKLPLVAVVGQKYTANPYGLYTKEVAIVPLPHPSGASTWKHKPEHKQLLALALRILKRELNV